MSAMWFMKFIRIFPNPVLFYIILPFVPFYFRKFEQQDMTLFVYYVLHVEFKKKKPHE